jgi:hypothetical protein
MEYGSIHASHRADIPEKEMDEYQVIEAEHLSIS